MSAAIGLPGLLIHSRDRGRGHDEGRPEPTSETLIKRNVGRSHFSYQPEQYPPTGTPIFYEQDPGGIRVEPKGRGASANRSVRKEVKGSKGGCL